MKITVRHETLYTYSRPVRLGPHLLRLHPRLDGALKLLEHHLHLEPEPVGRASCLDAEGNVVVHAWFLVSWGAVGHQRGFRASGLTGF
jgi:transglutaminase-like putative cysteine protease